MEFRTAIPTVTREYTPDSCCNSRNTMRHPPQRELRPESPALGAEQFRVPNQRRKEPQCALWNTRESPRKLSQDERNTVVTSGIQNSSVYHKSTRDEAHLPFNGSIAIPCSTSYRTTGLTSFRKLRDSLRHTSQVFMNINFSTATQGKHHAHHIIKRGELIPCL